MSSPASGCGQAVYFRTSLRRSRRACQLGFDGDYIWPGIPWCNHVVATHPYFTLRRSRGPGTGGTADHPRARLRRGPHQNFSPPAPASPIASSDVAAIRTSRGRCRSRPDTSSSVSSTRPALALMRCARVNWSPISAWSAATRSTRSAPRVSWCRSPMASIRPKRCASRSPISRPFRCSPATDSYCRVRPSSSSAPPAPLARRCSTWRAISASRRSAPARPRTWLLSSDLLPRRSTIAPATSSLRCED